MSGPPSEEIFDEKGALSLNGDDETLLAEVLTLSLHDFPYLLASFSEAHAGGRRIEARRLAHTIKGGAAAMGAVRFYRAALVMETTLVEGGKDVEDRISDLGAAWDEFATHPRVLELTSLDAASEAE